MNDFLEDVDFFSPDLYCLDTEWVKQPKLFFTYASKLAEARKEVEETKAELDVVKAELDKKIRESPESFDIIKLTETALSNTILLQPEYKKVSKKLIDTKYKADIFQAAVTALDHRKSALERLVALQGQNYFATPKAPESHKEQMAEIEKKAIRRKKKGNIE